MTQVKNKTHDVMSFLKTRWHLLLLSLFVGAYIVYFSIFTIMRYQGQYANYYDLGIMHQATHNSFRAIATGDWSRILEQTNTTGPEQIKRMAIHNDITLALFSLFYFIHDGPETLLFIQSLVVGLGAYAVYGICQQVFKKHTYKDVISLTFSFAYILNPLIQRTNVYEFHSVTLVTALLLYMFYFWLIQRYRLSFIFFLFSIFTKENVPLTTAFFSLYVLLRNVDIKRMIKERMAYIRSYSWSRYALLVLSVSIFWFLLSIKIIIPYFRVDDQSHFALSWYGDLGNSTWEVMFSVITRPWIILGVLFSPDRLYYLFLHLGYFGFISVFSPLTLLISLPELAVVMLSSNGNMRNIHFHYSAVITPWVFVSAIYSARFVITHLKKKVNTQLSTAIPLVYVIVYTVLFAYLYGPLPGSRKADTAPLIGQRYGTQTVKRWAEILRDDMIPVSASGRIAPFFTNRRYFYLLSTRYTLADYVIVSRVDALHGFGSRWASSAYEKLIEDEDFELIEKDNDIEVYRRIGVDR